MNSQDIVPAAPSSVGGQVQLTGDAQTVVHERQDSEKELMALFNTLTGPTSRQRPMRERALPPSFFSPSTANSNNPSNLQQGSTTSTVGHHSRDGSTDSSYSSQSSAMQSPAHHIRAMSEPAALLSSSRSLVTQDELLPPGWAMAMTMQGHRYYLNHHTKTTTWQDPRTLQQQQFQPQQQPQSYNPVSQQQRSMTGSSRSPFFSPNGSTGSVLGGNTLGQTAADSLQMQMEMNASLLQQQQQQHHQQQQLAMHGMPAEPLRQRSTSWIDPRGTGAFSRNQMYAQRQLLLQRQRLLQQHPEMLRQRLEQHDLLNMSGLTDDLVGAGALMASIGPGAVPHLGMGHRDAMARDPFMPVSGSISPDMALQFAAPSPASTALSHVREGSTDSGFGLGGMETGLGGAAGLDNAGQYDPLVGNTGLLSSFANPSMSPIPSVGSPRPASVASASSFLRQGNQPMADILPPAGFDAGFAGGALPMDTDDLAACMLGDGDLLNVQDLDNDPMLMQTML